MATEPQVTGYEEHPDNADWIRLTFADGQQAPYAYDPTKEFRSQATQVAQMTGLSAAPQEDPNSFNPPAGPAPTGMAPADIVKQYSPPAPAAPVAPAPTAYDNWETARIQQEMKNRPATAAAPTVPQGPVMVPGSAGVNKVTTTSTVLDPATRASMAAADTARANAMDVQRQADDTAVQSKTNVLNQRTENLSNESIDAKLAMQDVNDQLQKKQEARRLELARIKYHNQQPIDPGEAFRGDDGGAYAFMASIGMAIANFGSTLTGHGATMDPLAPIRDIIDRSVRIQTEQKRALFEAGKITLDELNADVEALKSSKMALGAQIVEKQKGLDNTKEELAGIDGMTAAFRAEEAKTAAAAADAKANQAISLAPHRSEEHAAGTKAHQATGAELGAMYKVYADVYKDDPQAAASYAASVGLNVANGKPVSGEQGRRPTSEGSQKDARDSIRAISGVLNSIKEIDGELKITRDAKGNVVKMEGDIGPLKSAVHDWAVTGMASAGAAAGGVLGALVGAPAAGVGAIPAAGIGAGVGGGAGAAAGKGIQVGIDALRNGQENAAVRGALNLAQNRLKLRNPSAEPNDGATANMLRATPLTSTRGFQAGTADAWREAQARIRDLRAHYGSDYVDNLLRQEGYDPGQY